MAASVRHENETAYLHVPCESKDGPLIFLIPGNPGICEYYLEFVNELSSQLPGHEIVAPSHRGYSLESAAGAFQRKTFSLEEQIRHKIEFLNSIVTEKRKVIVLGHSVGAWIAQRVVTHFRNSDTVNVEFVGLLTPTVKDIAQSERGGRFTMLAKYVKPAVVASVLRVFYYLVPGFFWRILLRRLFRKKQNPDYVRQVSLKYVQRPALVYQTLSLATEEMERISSDTEPEDIDGFWNTDKYTIWGFFAYHDHWVSPRTRQELFDRYSGLPNVHFELIPDASIPHAFCINASAPAADLVAAAIRKFEAPVRSLASSEVEASMIEIKAPAPEVLQRQSPTEVPSVPPPQAPKVSQVPAEAEADGQSVSSGHNAASATGAVKVERLSTPTSAKADTAEGSKTPRSVNSKESFSKRSSMRKIGRALSRKKKDGKDVGDA